MYLVCIVHACSTACVRTAPPHNEALHGEGEGKETKTEEMTEPQRLQCNPAYCYIEMTKKTPMSYDIISDPCSIGVLTMCGLLDSLRVLGNEMGMLECYI